MHLLYGAWCHRHQAAPLPQAAVVNGVLNCTLLPQHESLHMLMLVYLSLQWQKKVWHLFTSTIQVTWSLTFDTPSTPCDQATFPWMNVYSASWACNSWFVMISLSHNRFSQARFRGVISYFKDWLSFFPESHSTFSERSIKWQCTFPSENSLVRHMALAI